MENLYCSTFRITYMHFFYICPSTGKLNPCCLPPSFLHPLHHPHPSQGSSQLPWYLPGLRNPPFSLPTLLPSLSQVGNNPCLSQATTSARRKRRLHDATWGTAVGLGMGAAEPGATFPSTSLDHMRCQQPSLEAAGISYGHAPLHISFFHQHPDISVRKITLSSHYISLGT